MNYGTIKNYDIANGTGVKGSAFSYPAAGIIAKDASIRDLGFQLRQSIYQKRSRSRDPRSTQTGIYPGIFPPRRRTLRAGESKELAGLLQKIKESYPEKNVWCYTGYLYDVDLIPGGKVYTEYTDKMLACIDTLVDGEFIEAKRSHPGIPRKPQQRILHLDEIRQNAKN